MSKPLIYVASPHSHPSEDVRDKRYEDVCRYSAGLINAGNLIYSPIAHSHNMAKYIGDEANCFEYWREIDLFYLEHSDIVHALMLDGWLNSDGMGKELTHATNIGKPVVYIPWEDDLPC